MIIQLLHTLRNFSINNITIEPLLINAFIIGISIGIVLVTTIHIFFNNPDSINITDTSGSNSDGSKRNKNSTNININKSNDTNNNKKKEQDEIDTIVDTLWTPHRILNTIVYSIIIIVIILICYNDYYLKVKQQEDQQQVQQQQVQVQQQQNNTKDPVLAMIQYHIQQTFPKEYTIVYNWYTKIQQYL